MFTDAIHHNSKLVSAAIPILLLAQVLLAQNVSDKPTGNSQPSAAGANGSAPDKRTLDRVHARKLDGFELARKSSDSATQVAGASRSFGSDTTLLAPRKGRAYGLNPLFRWSNANNKIKSYTFRLLASDRQAVIYEAEVAGTSWKYPSEAPALKPGSRYFWTVQPSMKVLGDAADPAEVIVEGGDARAKLADKLSGLPEWSQQRAELFVESRIWYDAVEIYTRLIADNPSDSQFLLARAELYDQLPQTSEAAANDRQRAGSATR